jgi:hypothetical protein
MPGSKENLIKAWDANECFKVNINDGPYLNNFCKEKEKCINDHNYVFLLQILIKIVKDIVNAMPSYYFLAFLIVLTIIILFKRK